VIGTRIGALVELVDDGVDGFLFELGDARDLAEKVTRLWTDTSLARRMGVAARAKAARWQRSRHVEALRAIYANAVHSPIGSTRP
jgi:glycosyltransferase involved in cell wall biosynthesis